MNIEQTWKTVLEQLQTDLPRASFETWVRDTQALSSAGGVLTVAVRNAYARDWLESRLLDTVNNILSRDNLRVNFVVPQAEVDAVEVETDSVAQEEEPDNALDISPEAYDSVYEQIVRPDRAVYLPGYFRRWLRSIGPDLGWMYVSFRQAAYLAGARSGSKSSRFSGKQLASMCGISERTYWNRVNNPNTWQKLSGLVRIIEGGDEWVKGPTPKRLPRKYTVAMTLPLTPIDTASLKNWLAANKEKHGGAEGVLRAAMIAPLDALIPLQAKEESQPLSVRALLRNLFKDELAEGLLDSLASALQARLMPQSDLIVISLFFIEHVLPHLDAGPGWMLTLLRDSCYVNPESGETRNRVTVKGGYAEIAGWLGMSRPRTVWDWFNEKNGPKHDQPGMLKNPVVRVFMREVPGAKSEDFARSPRAFEVLLEDLPHEILEAALTDNFAGLTASRDATFSIGMTRLADHLDATFSIVVTPLAHYLDATFTIVVTLLSHHHDATCIVKSSLTLKPNPLTLNPQPSPETRWVDGSSLAHRVETEVSEPPQSEADGGGRVGNLAFWDFDFLVRNNSVNPVSKGRLLRTNKGFGRSIADLSGGFVSWLLYAYSPTGAKVSDPVGLAVKRLCENVNAGAGGDFNRLAKLTPYALRALFDADMAGMDPGDSVEAGIYKLNFHDLQPIHKQELYRRLFGNPRGA